MSDEAKEVKKAKAPRRPYRNDNWTEEQVKAKKSQLTLEEVPAGWVKISEVATTCRANGVPISKFVRAFGGDRGMQPVAHELFKFVYVGRTRYVAPEVMTQGIAMLKDPSFLKAARVRKPKAEKGEKAESGPVAGAKQEQPGRRVALRPGHN